MALDMEKIKKEVISEYEFRMELGEQLSRDEHLDYENLIAEQEGYGYGCIPNIAFMAEPWSCA